MAKEWLASTHLPGPRNPNHCQSLLAVRERRMSKTDSSIFPLFSCACLFFPNPGFIILLLSAFQLVHGESMVNCPECGKPLVKQTTGSKYNCENERCTVIYVKYPLNIAIRTVVRSSLRKR